MQGVGNYVVVFHANASAQHLDGPVWAWPSTMQHGVDFSFVLSGFITLHAHRRYIGVTVSVPIYLQKRAIRLRSPLWAAVIGCVLLRMVAGAPVDGQTRLEVRQEKLMISSG